MIKFNPELNPITLGDLEKAHDMAKDNIGLVYCHCIGEAVKFSIIMPDLKPSLAVDKNGLVYQIDYAGNLG